MTLLQELDYVRNFVRKQMEALGKNIEDPKAYRAYAEAKKSLDILASNEEIWKAGVQAMADKIEKETPVIHSEIASRLTKEEVMEFSIYKSHLALLEQYDHERQLADKHKACATHWHKEAIKEMTEVQSWIKRYGIKVKQARFEIQAAKYLNV